MDEGYLEKRAFATRMIPEVRDTGAVKGLLV